MTVQQLRDENEALLKRSDSYLKDCNDMLALNNKEMALHYLKMAENCNEQRLINCKRMESLEKSEKQDRLISILEGALKHNQDTKDNSGSIIKNKDEVLVKGNVEGL